MKSDQYGCLIREKYEAAELGNYGDSCAETCRALVLYSWTNPKNLHFEPFMTADGRLLRHWRLFNIPGWGTEDFANDQYLPLILATNRSSWYAPEVLRPSVLIPGTNTLISPGVWAASRRRYALLNFFNIIQGLLFHFRWRWSDDERFKGKFWKLERSEGKVQDWLNYAIVFIYLQQTGRWSTLNQPVERVMKAIRLYYLEGDDWEPNSQWIVDLYEKALGVRP